MLHIQELDDNSFLISLEIVSDGGKISFEGVFTMAAESQGERKPKESGLSITARFQGE